MQSNQNQSNQNLSLPGNVADRGDDRKLASESFDEPQKLQLYAITGRVPEDDDDTLDLVVATNEVEAQNKFRASLTGHLSPEEVASIEGPHGTACYVIESRLIGDYAGNGILQVSPELAVSMADNDGMKPFTVLGNYRESGQLFAHHVHARNGLQAFAVVAELHGDAEFTVALPGHLNEGNDQLVFPGESVVDAETVLEQPEVFGGPLGKESDGGLSFNM